ncbi:Endopolyphosphatase [Exophiala xenobiotica]|nr:Endopolyphosphatase [Exophiala xenobiotica]
MVRFTGGLLLFSALALAAPRNPLPHGQENQQVLINPASKSQPGHRKLQGRFLHITDIHPDPFYKSGSDSDEACHAGKGQAGYYGAEVTDCDTPFTLVNATFKWIENNIKDQIDFVIWTGDSARHDNDERFPRSDKQVIKLNKYVVEKFVEVFGKPDNINDPDPTNDFVVPIVPTFGNNDILPHNIFLPGPNKWTRTYSSIWNKFVPGAQRHSFARGGWFFTEVIPNKLAVISLNTLYFFDSNSAVDGCDLKSEPGYEHMEWLRIQLQFLRERGMKAMLIGHVPPARTESKQNWDESCYQKYTLWMRQYRDVIIASIYGHMNVDHFMFQDVKDLTYKFKIKGISDEFSPAESFEPDSTNETFSIAAKTTYLNELREGWSNLPKPPSGHSYITEYSNDMLDIEKKKKKKKKPTDEEKLAAFLKEIGGPWGERFSLSLVSPSVVPNFFPTLRVVDYNITGLEDHHPAPGAVGTPAEVAETASIHEIEDLIFEDDDANEEVGSPADDMHDLKKKRKRKKKGKKKKSRRPKFPVPKPPSKSSPPGPGYSPQPLSLISWTQYYSNLTRVHEDMHGHGRKKNPEHYFDYQVEYSTKNDSVYRMNDLTMRSWLDLADRIGREKIPSPKSEAVGDDLVAQSELDMTKKGKRKKESRTAKNHVWRTFVKRAFVHTKSDDEIDEDFG